MQWRRVAVSGSGWRDSGEGRQGAWQREGHGAASHDVRRGAPLGAEGHDRKRRGDKDGAGVGRQWGVVRGRVRLRWTGPQGAWGSCWLMVAKGGRWRGRVRNTRLLMVMGACDAN